MSHQTKTITVASDNFEREVLESPRPVLVDFWAGWCAPCRMIAPSIEELAADYSGRAAIAKLDVDRSPEVAERFGIRAIPSLLIFRGGEVVDRIVGGAPKAALAAKLEEALAEAGHGRARRSSLTDRGCERNRRRAAAQRRPADDPSRQTDGPHDAAKRGGCRRSQGSPCDVCGFA